jgi:hypothetical protein
LSSTEQQRDYCFNLDNPRGRNKARVFASALGLTAADADQLAAVLLAAAQTNEAQTGEFDRFGQRYTIDCEVERTGRKAALRSGWIIRHDEDSPRLTTCYVLKRKRS